MNDTITLTLDLNQAEILSSLLQFELYKGHAAEAGTLDDLWATLTKLNTVIGDALAPLDAGGDE